MIKQITFENWKSLRHTTLHFAPYMALVGAKSSGKTSTLEALLFLSRTAHRKNIRDALKGDATQPAIRGGAEGVAFRSAEQFTLSVLLQGEDEHNDYRYTLSVEPASYLVVAEKLVSVEYDPDTGEIAEEMTLFNIDVDKDTSDTLYEESLGMGLMERIDRIVGLSGLYTSLCRFEEKLPRKIIHVIPSMQHIVVMEPAPDAMRSYTPLVNELQSNGANLSGVLAKLPPDRKAHIESLLSSAVARLPACAVQRVWAEPVGRLQRDAMLYAEVQDTDPASADLVLIDASTMPDTVLRFLAILAALLLLPEGSLLAIEHIETGFTPEEVEVVLATLRNLGQQHHVGVLMTSQTPTLFSQLAPDALPAITVARRNPDAGDSTLTLVDDAADLQHLLELGEEQEQAADSNSAERVAARSAIERALARKRKQ